MAANGSFGGESGHRCVLKPKLAHSGEECSLSKNKCNKQEGKCDWCGTEGWCCRKGFIGNGCDGSFGGESGHRCVLKPN